MSASAGDPTPFFTPARRHPEGLGADRKIPRVSGQATAPGGACGAGSCCAGVWIWSGGGFEGDAVAHRDQLGDVVAVLAFGVDAAGVVVGAEVAEAGGGVGEQVPDDDQDGAGDRDEGLEFAAAFDDAPVAFAEEGVGLGGRGGGLAERAFQVGVALAGLAAACRGRTGWCVGTVSPRRPGGRRWGTGSCPGRSRRG